MKKQMVLPIVEQTNVSAFRIARLLVIPGIIALFVSFNLEVGTVRTILAVLGLVLVGSPFGLSLLMKNNKQIGMIKLTEEALILKLKGESVQEFPVERVRSLFYDVNEFEGETKVSDMLFAASRMKVRDGISNQLTWTFEEEKHAYNIKLSTQNQKDRLIETLQNIEQKLIKTV